MSRQLLDAAISEKAFQDQVVRLAKLSGYRCHHHYESRRSEAGWPDLVCVPEDGYGPIIIAELKAEKGRVSVAQQFWLARLDLGEALEDYLIVRLWRPSDWDAIVETFQGRKENAA